MKLKITKTKVWAAPINDQPGGLAQVLAGIAQAGADLDCIIARRTPDKPGKGVVFLTPLTGKRIMTAAGAAGFHATQRVSTLRVEGDNRAGLGAKATQALAEAGINLRGLSAAVLGRKFVCYLGFDTDAEAASAMKVLKALGRKK